MIHYQLRCGSTHEFDGWFCDSAAYDDQARRGLLECPVCGERNVVRAMMSPAVARKASKAAATVPTPDAAATAAAPPANVAVTPERLPAQLRATLQRMRAEVERRCDYVGDGFAAEARRIHDGESEARGIYGEATPEQAQALADDGIEVAQIPWVPPADA